MRNPRRPSRRTVLSLAGALLAAAAMLIASPVQNPLPAFLLWTLFFGVLLLPPGHCAGATRS